MNAQTFKLPAFFRVLALVGLLLQTSQLAYSAPTQVFDPNDCDRILSFEAPLGISKASMERKHFSYGLEVEYAIEEANERLLSDYAPALSLLPRAEWNAMAVADKRTYVKSHLSELFPEGPKGPSFLIQVKEEKFFPAALIADETGNIELISPIVFQSYPNFDAYLTEVQNRYGDGYVQASLGVPTAPIFKTSKKIDQFLGLSFFLGELDTFKKLSESYVKHLDIPLFIPGKSFTHPFLGPMNSYRARFYRNVLKETSENRFDKEVLKRISNTDVSYKYTSQVVYRPDILKSEDLFLMEVRQCVKDFDCLRKLLQRQKYFFKRSTVAFEAFGDVAHFDPTADFNMFSNETQTMLKASFPRVLERDVGDEIVAAEIYRNFAYPMNDWNQWVARMGRGFEGSKQVVATAQRNYKMDLERIAHDFQAKTIDAKAAGSQTRVALARFAHDSTLTELFEQFVHSRFSDLDPSLL